MPLDENGCTNECHFLCKKTISETKLLMSFKLMLMIVYILLMNSKGVLKNLDNRWMYRGWTKKSGRHIKIQFMGYKLHKLAEDVNKCKKLYS